MQVMHGYTIQRLFSIIMSLITYQMCLHMPATPWFALAAWLLAARGLKRAHQGAPKLAMWVSGSLPLSLILWILKHDAMWPEQLNMYLGMATALASACVVFCACEALLQRLSGHAS